MALAINVQQVETDQKGVYIFGTLTASGNYATGGDTLDFTAVGVVDKIAAGTAPVQVWIGGTTGDSYGWVVGSSLANGKVKINTASATELAAAAYPARITGDANIQFEAIFKKFL